jgi:hypothetical protein
MPRRRENARRAAHATTPIYAFYGGEADDEDRSSARPRRLTSERTPHTSIRTASLILHTYDLLFVLSTQRTYGPKSNISTHLSVPVRHTVAAHNLASPRMLLARLGDLYAVPDGLSCRTVKKDVQFLRLLLGAERGHLRVLKHENLMRRRRRGGRLDGSAAQPREDVPVGEEATRQHAVSKASPFSDEEVTRRGVFQTDGAAATIPRHIAFSFPWVFSCNGFVSTFSA